MSYLKIAVIGAGSFVFGPGILSQALLEHKLQNVELALVDTDAQVLECMAGVGQQMVRQSGLQVTLSTHVERAQALDGADFVTCSVNRQGIKRFLMDAQIVQRYLPGHLLTEFGGVAGISNSLRQIAMIEELAEDMQHYCPQARLLNVANPLPRVCQAAHAHGVKTLGLCAVSLQAYSMLWQLLYGTPLPYPFTEARKRWWVTTAGLNHFVWLTDFRDRETGADLLPQFRRALAEGRGWNNPRSEAITRETGSLLAPSDDHTRDFLPPLPTSEGPVELPFHGSAEERERRLKLLQRVAQGEESYAVLLDHPVWERPIDVVVALSGGEAVTLHSLDLVNEGQIPELPHSVFVETPCTVTADGPKPHTVHLPKSVLPSCLRTAQISDTIVQAGLQRKRALVHEAIELDPTILDKAAGIQAIDACLQAHADLLPHYT